MDFSTNGFEISRFTAWTEQSFSKSSLAAKPALIEQEFKN
jgi:hypothetical protein